jgi:hypothetical protein
MRGGPVSRRSCSKDKAGVGGLWRDLPAWQDIQISPADWALVDLPLLGATQPHILANIDAWVQRFGLADGIRLNAPVRQVRASGSGWDMVTPQGRVRARQPRCRDGRTQHAADSAHHALE